MSVLHEPVSLHWFHAPSAPSESRHGENFARLIFRTAHRPPLGHARWCNGLWIGNVGAATAEGATSDICFGPAAQVLPANTSKVAVVSDKSNSCVGKVLHGRPFGTSYGRRMGIDGYREPLTPLAAGSPIRGWDSRADPSRESPCD
jgi:hypothetical protein